MKRTLRQAFIALLATLLVLEGALQIASLFARPLLTRASELPGSPDAITILCVGDSHTYGAPLPEHESYPSQLQAALKKRYPSREFRVINLGFPGVNSAFVAQRLESQLLQLRPHIVMISGGLNNSWNDLHADAGESGFVPSLRRALLRVKLFRLWAVARAKGRFQPTESGDGRWDHPDHGTFWPELEGKVYAQPRGVPVEQVTWRVERDMERMVETARALEVPVIWYNYPRRAGVDRKLVDVIDATGARIGVPVVHSLKALQRAIADGHRYRELFVWAAGPHPTGILYGYIVQDMVPVVAATLAERYGIDLAAGAGLPGSAAAASLPATP